MQLTVGLMGNRTDWWSMNKFEALLYAIGSHWLRVCTGNGSFAIKIPFNLKWSMLLLGSSRQVQRTVLKGDGWASIYTTISPFFTHNKGSFAPSPVNASLAKAIAECWWYNIAPETVPAFCRCQPCLCFWFRIHVPNWGPWEWKPSTWIRDYIQTVDGHGAILLKTGLSFHWNPENVEISSDALC